MSKQFFNVSLRLRLTILTMLFVVGLSGSLLLLINRNATLKISSVAVPLTKIYAVEGTSTLFPNVLSQVPGIAYPPMPAVSAAAQLSVTTDAGESSHATSPAVKLEKATFVLSTTAQDIRQYSYIVFGAVVLFSGFLVYYWCGRMLKPVQQLAIEMQERTVNTLNQPIENENAVAEMKQLSDSFNHMIENLNQSFEIQKQFNANAAHELRTPIAILQANMEMLEEDSSPSLGEYQEFMAVAHRMVSRMSLLVESLLQMTQLEQATKSDTIALSPLIDRVVWDAKGIAAEKNVSIAYVKPPFDCYIKGDETLFFTAVYNLVENAVKYNKNKGSVQVQLTQETDSAVITVSDTGMGIEPLELMAIFQPFYRVDKSRARGLGGAGMGLNLVKNIAEFHMGTVKAKSELGVGSSFQICVPLWISND